MWKNSIVNPDKFDKNLDPSYIYAPFDSKDVQINALAETRKQKIDKYDPIVNEVKTCLQENLDEIRIKHKMSNVKVDCEFIVI
jgi:hypothetical protein